MRKKRGRRARDLGGRLVFSSLIIIITAFFHMCALVHQSLNHSSHPFHHQEKKEEENVRVCKVCT
jgi:hypothetical protein